MSLNIEVPQLVRAEDNDRVGDRKMVTIQMYHAPLDGSEDVFKYFDDQLARRVNEILTKAFPGYPWRSAADSRQGVIYFSIPILMGPTLNHVIRLADWGDLSARLVRKGGGEILDRFNLPYTKFEESSFLHARDNKHLAQIDFKRRQ